MIFNYHYFAFIILVAAHLAVNTKGDDEGFGHKNNSRLWWPVGCIVYGGVSNSDDDIIKGDSDDDEEVLNGVKFILFSNETSASDQTLIIENVASFTGLKFNSATSIRILVHGWRDKTSNEMTQVIKNAYFARNELINIIGVDWGEYASYSYYPYVASVYVPKVGFTLAKFIEFLVQKLSVSLSNIQVIGHSLGAQVCGYAGQYLINLGVGRLPVIVGLDPALPSFQNSELNERLDAKDADYVEIIHTASGCKGFDVQAGTADFYPNFSRLKHKQPGCGLDILWECSHARAYYFFAESLTKKGSFKSVSCKSYEELENEQCNKTNGENYMGGYSLEKKDASGIYYLKTNANSPYSLS